MLKKSDVIHLINKYSPIIFAIQETWLKPVSIFKIPGYACIREDRPDGYNGVALLIRHSIPFSHFPITHSNDYSIVAAIINNICTVSLYIPHPSPSIYNELYNIISSLPKPFLILGDLNAQHISWGSSISNPNGNTVYDMMDTLNVCILNTGSPTRRTSPDQGLSAPDLSICSPDLAPFLTWEVLSSSYGSDHFPILLSLPIKCPTPPTKSPRLKYKLDNVNWSQFREIIDHKISLLPLDPQGTEASCAEALAKSFIEAADEVFPMKTVGRINIPSPPWWDRDCTEAVKKRKLAELVYNESSTNDNFDLVMKAMTECSKTLKQKKFNGWRAFCLSISPNVSPSLVWRNIRRFRSAFNDSTSSTLPLPLANKFLDKLAPPSAPEFILPRSLNVDNTGLNSPFSFHEIKGVISHLKDSAPGIDGIPYSFISNLSNESLTYLLNLVNNIIKSGNIPPSWRIQEVLPILKPNKDPSDALSYRPIALSSVLLKITEHLIKNRLEWFIESRRLLSNSQYGFRRGKSTTDSIAIFVTDIRLAFSCNQSVAAAFLDITAAYDNVVLSILYKKLVSLNVPSMLCSFIMNILSERCIHLKLEDTNVLSRFIWRGLPQGSVLSPILYNIYSSDLETSLDSNTQVLQYADDLLIYNTHKSIPSACSNLSSSLTLLKTWLDRNGLEVSPPKSSVVIFSRRRYPPIEPVYYNDIPIPVKPFAKFLGVVLDYNLSGKPHVDHVIKKCERNLNILRCLSGVWWGAHPFSLKLLYNAIIRSVIDYATFIIEPGNLDAFKRLDIIQSKALRIVCGAMRSSPVNCLQVECVDPPLHLRRQFLSDKFLFRVFQFMDHPLHNKLQALFDHTNSSTYWSHKPVPCLVRSYQKFIYLQAPTHQSLTYPLFAVEFDALTISPNIILNFGVLKDDHEANINFNRIVDSDWAQTHHIYTDASKHGSSNHVGVGIYHKQYKIVQKIKFPSETSVFTGECFGLFKAVDYILTAKLKNTIIFTDAMSALQALMKFPFKTKNIYPIIMDIRKLLLKCSQMGYSVSFAWIPGHSNIYGNERADQLANEATECGDLVPYKNYSHDLAALPATFLQNSWRDVWGESSRVKGKFYFSIQQNIIPKPWFFRFKLGKRATSSLIRMRLGHTCCPAHLSRIKIRDNDMCDCGLNVGDLNHIFFECPLYDHSSLFHDLLSLKIPFPTCIPVLLASNNFSVYKSLSTFILSYDLKL